MKILAPEQIKQCDDYTIKHLPISSIDLMEKAAEACVKYITGKLAKPDKAIIICGKGNNGGDGLAIARLLNQNNYNVDVFILEYSQKSTPDFDENLKRYNGKITRINNSNELKILSTKKTLIIDAILGNGLNKPIDGLIKDTIDLLNSAEGYKLAIDIPTGLFATIPSNADSHIFKANTTLTFQTPKLAFLMKENYSFVGNFQILDIGWKKDADKDLETDFYYTTIKEITSFYKKREKFVSKNDFGHALIIAGSIGKIGAALLATKACMKSGAGLTTTYAPKCAFEILQSQAPEAMFIPDTNNEFISELPELKNYSAIAIGPGLGLNEKTKSVVEQLILKSKSVLVIDADAINVLAENKQLLNHIKPNTIITPHSKEFERLTQKCESDYERLHMGIEFAKKYKIILVLKGAYTAIINCDGKVYFNSTGNSALAKGGSGDTLTGIIVAHLCKGYSPLNAAILSVYIHGMAADICIESQSKETVIATDIINAIETAFLNIEAN